jgi:DNA repair exonuclease SbcCD ATPase subunit
MRLLRVALTHVRGVERCEVRFDERGVTVVEAPNESGKSTVLDAVDVLLSAKDSSGAQRVRDLQPAGQDVGSTIEVELTCGPHRLTCHKTFNRDRATVLHVHEPVVEHWTGGEAHDRLRQLLEADVDLALYEALRFGQDRGVSEPVALDGSQVLAARLDASAGDGGAGEADAAQDGGGQGDLLERVEAERLRWFTPTGRPGRELVAAEAAVATAESEVAELSDRVAALARDVERLAEVEVELPRLERRRGTELRPAVERLEAQRERILAVAARLRGDRAEVELAGGRLADAQRRRTERRDLVTDVAHLTERLGALDAGLATARQDASRLESRMVEHRTVVTEAQRRLAAARQAADLAEVVADLVSARDTLAELRQRHRHATELTDQGRAAERELATLTIDTVGLAAIRRAHQQVEVARATLTAAAPTVAVRAHRDVVVDVDGTPTDVAAGQQQETSVVGRLTLDVPGVAEVEVVAGSSAAELRAAVTEAEAALAAACDHAGVADLERAEAAHDRRRELEALLARRDDAVARELAGSTLDALAGRVETGTARVAELQQRLAASRRTDGEVPDPAALPSLDEARRHRDDTRRAVRDAAAALDTARAVLTDVGDQHADRCRDVERSVERRSELVARLEDRRGRLAEERAASDDEPLDAAVGAAERAAADAREAVSATERELEGLCPDAVEQDLTDARRQLAEVDQQLAELGTVQTQLRERLRLGGEQGLGERLAQAEDHLVRVRASCRRATAHAAAVARLHAELTAAREEAYRGYRGPLRDRIVAHARTLLGVDVDVELDDQLRLVRRTVDGVTLPWEALSVGAREQLAILTALAAAELAGSDGVPFVLDDALGSTDPQRRERLGAVLGTVTDAQVIVLTCDAQRFAHVPDARTVPLLDTTDRATAGTAEGTTTATTNGATRGAGAAAADGGTEGAATSEGGRSDDAAPADASPGSAGARPRPVSRRKRPAAGRRRGGQPAPDSGAEPLQLDLGAPG